MLAGVKYKHACHFLSQSQLLISSESLRDYVTVKIDILPTLRQLLRVDLNRADQCRIIELLRQLQPLCMLPSLTQPNKHNQIMLDNFGMTIEYVQWLKLILFLLGIVSDIMSFVLDKGTSEQKQLVAASPGLFSCKYAY